MDGNYNITLRGQVLPALDYMVLDTSFENQYYDDVSNAIDNIVQYLPWAQFNVDFADGIKPLILTDILESNNLGSINTALSKWGLLIRPYVDHLLRPIIRLLPRYPMRDVIGYVSDEQYPPKTLVPASGITDLTFRAASPQLTLANGRLSGSPHFIRDYLVQDVVIEVPNRFNAPGYYRDRTIQTTILYFDDETDDTILDLRALGYRLYIYLRVLQGHIST